ncbi:hypothetical protein HK099_000315 [Clydaea vesicula]|uniref:Bromo domain-containing protein n=1 Tax=Clydaea vesicula TaxID=447962 RepID=A0AAD5TY54_9FUNG|nr:hypothetical protein HK099_000315 [Clydaea vesicula]
MRKLSLDNQFNFVESLLTNGPDLDILQHLEWLKLKNPNINYSDKINTFISYRKSLKDQNLNSLLISLKKKKILKIRETLSKLQVAHTKLLVECDEIRRGEWDEKLDNQLEQEENDDFLEEDEIEEDLDDQEQLIDNGSPLNDTSADFENSVHKDLTDEIIPQEKRRNVDEITTMQQDSAADREEGDISVGLIFDASNSELIPESTELNRSDTTPAKTANEDKMDNLDHMDVDHVDETTSLKSSEENIYGTPIAEINEEDIKTVTQEKDEIMEISDDNSLVEEDKEVDHVQDQLDTIEELNSIITTPLKILDEAEFNDQENFSDNKRILESESVLNADDFIDEITVEAIPKAATVLNRNREDLVCVKQPLVVEDNNAEEKLISKNYDGNQSQNLKENEIEDDELIPMDVDTSQDNAEKKDAGIISINEEELQDSSTLVAVVVEEELVVQRASVNKVEPETENFTEKDLESFEEKEELNSSPSKLKKTKDEKGESEFNVNDEMEESDIDLKSEAELKEEKAKIEKKKKEEKAKKEFDKKFEKQSKERERKEEKTKKEAARKVEKLKKEKVKKKSSVVAKPGEDHYAGVNSTSTTNISDEELKAFKKTANMIFERIAEHRCSAVFANPVKQETDPEYFQLVKQPLCLNQIKAKINRGEIKTNQEFHTHILHVFTNAIMYNNKGSEIYNMAVEMKEFSELELRNLAIYSGEMKSLTNFLPATTGHVHALASSSLAEQGRRKSFTPIELSDTYLNLRGSDIVRSTSYDERSEEESELDDLNTLSNVATPTPVTTTKKNKNKRTSTNRRKR